MTDAAARLASALADRYRLERELGQGGMATVYLAEDLKHRRKVAIKMLHPELSAVIGPERFLKEIELTASLQHPHILPLFDSGAAEHQLYYVMPFVEGETLRARLDREKQLPIDDAVRIAKEVASALEYAHKRGVVHRDIKPENVLLQGDSALVADFGIALAVQQAGGSRMTQTGMSLGTPHYMSPEQAMGDRDIGPRSDVYALGAMTYEMIGGDPPFTGHNSQAILAKVLTEQPAPLRPKRPTVTAAVEGAVLTALQKLPADRFGSAKEFADALEGTGKAATYAATVVTRAARPAARVPTRTLALVAAAALASAAMVWFLRPVAVPARGPAWQGVMAFPDSAQPDPDGFPSLSADGTLLVYGGAAPRGRRVWLRRADMLELTPVAGSEGFRSPVISPDGRRIAAAADRAGLLVLPLSGGAATTVVKDNSYSGQVAWFDATRLMYPHRSGIARIGVSGGPEELITTIDTAAGEVYHLAPAALPEGRGVAFTVWPGALDDMTRARVAVIGPDGGAHTILMPGIHVAYTPGFLLVSRADGTIAAVPFDAATRKVTGAPITIVSGLSVSILSSVGYLTVTPGGRMAYVRRTSGGLVDLLRVRVNGAATPLDTAWAGTFSSVALSVDGRQVVVGLTTPSTEEVAVRDLGTRALTRIGVPDGFLRTPRFLPDGSILYAKVGAGVNGIYRASPGNVGLAEQLLSSDKFVTGPVMSPDGRTVYFSQYAGVASDVLAHRVGEDASRHQSVLAGAAAERIADLSPDGRWLAYVSNESGEAALYVRSTDAARAERWQVSGTEGVRGEGARWSRDGRSLFYLTADSMIAAIVPGGAAFSVTGRRALFAAAAYMPRFDLFPDGSFVMMRERAGSAEFVMVDDWHALLPR